MRSYYDLSKKKRKELFNRMQREILSDLIKKEKRSVLKYAGNKDTYIRKNVYVIIGRIYKCNKNLRQWILSLSKSLFSEKDKYICQTAVYLFGEIGQMHSGRVMEYLKKALRDKSPVVRRGLVGALKRMGEKNPGPVLKLAREFLDHPDPEVVCSVIHGAKLWGRTHPEDILPLLRELQDDSRKKVRKMLIHISGQISYKKGCLKKVALELRRWHNHNLVENIINEILSVHKRYERFSALSVGEARSYLERKFSAIHKFSFGQNPKI